MGLLIELKIMEYVKHSKVSGRTKYIFTINTGLTHFIKLCFIALHRFCIFFLNKLKVCGNCGLSIIFPKALAHFHVSCVTFW